MVQSEVLIKTYNGLLWKQARRYTRINPNLRGYEEDLYQEGAAALVRRKDTFNEEDSPALGWFRADLTVRKAMRVFQRTFLGANIERGYADKANVVNPMKTEDLLNGCFSGDGDKHELSEQSCTQPSLETKDLLEKLITAGKHVLGSKEFASLFMDPDADEVSAAELNRRRSNKHNAITKLRAYVKENWI